MNLLEGLRLRRSWPPRRLSLALQGGGSFGAFTWGVLDRLLEEQNVAVDTVSGTSAGAINAVLLAAGLAEGGAQAARAKLARFWERLSRTAAFGPFGGAAGFAPGASGTFSFWTRLLSPYQYNPLDLNPLRALINEEVDFKRLRHAAPIGLLIAATRVADGRARIFRDSEIDADAVLASASLPLYHHAVTIDDIAYWDGGYSANPPLLDLVMASEAPDVLVVQITPMHSAAVPTTSRDIIRRLDQITFNASLQAEIGMLAWHTARSRGLLGLLSHEGRKLRRLNLHRIAAEEEFTGLSEASASNLDWGFLSKLKEDGRAAATAWLGRKEPEAAAFGLELKTSLAP
ncbi:MAG TPA: patatin-like phospholipase family protein [Methylovirgula sp.]|nr:patatin-like phospholipase family protein [Methylovirgula sp.]